ncbi:NusA-like transcription termination signal-binding factor [Methanococcus maripaludis]|uniref:Probable transcription termination protein NusA n=2 Tax=Methanococcus maripaludis TaxID=39152 RepID=A0A7J9PDN1_METMI|nr:NusA-like transcription termination signal-binding factor [Methanococcus maripaludis]MBA2861332.1 N utilization substance protein A [Methanococcus maripaludis]
MKIKLNTEDIMRISLFEKMTGANVIDSTSDDEKIVFVVKEGDIGAAIGKGGENVKSATEKFGKKIDLIEYSEDVKQFIKNIFAPVELEDVWTKKFSDDLVVYVRVHPRLRRAVIGDKGKNIDRAVDIAGRLAGVKNIKVVAGLRKDNDKKPKQDEIPEKAAESSTNVEAEENQ